MAPHSSTLAWKIPWTEEPGRLQSTGSQRVWHDWATSLSLHSEASLPFPIQLFESILNHADSISLISHCIDFWLGLVHGSYWQKTGGQKSQKIYGWFSNQIVEDRGIWHASVSLMVSQSQTQLSYWTTISKPPLSDVMASQTVAVPLLRSQLLCPQNRIPSVSPAPGIGW